MCDVDLLAEAEAHRREGKDDVILIRQEAEPLNHQLGYPVHRLDIRMLPPENYEAVGISLYFKSNNRTFTEFFNLPKHVCIQIFVHDN